MLRCALIFFALTAALPAQQLQPHTLQPPSGAAITLNLPEGFDIHIAASGLSRPRFFASAPDGRIFLTTMFNLADNTRGSIVILDGWDGVAHRFTRVIPYLQHLRNPNNIAFYTDPAGASWMYVPLTDKLVRYRFHPGDTAPTGPPQLLMRFPDYGLNYKYGGWHLTRTVAIATLHGRTQLYVAAGSSCNYCLEREAQRASLIAMDPDGKNARIVAHGLRNAVGLRFVPELDGGALVATNMGDDHLGDKLPEDTFYELDSNDHPGPISHTPAPNYGWPTCYFANAHAMLDATPLPTNPGPTAKAVAPEPPGSPQTAKARTAADSVYGNQHGVAAAGTNLGAPAGISQGLPDLGAVPAALTSCKNVPAALTTFPAHSSPLGFAYFFAAGDPHLTNTFLIALHGAGHTRIGTGYKLVRFDGTHGQQDFLTGFLTHTGSTPVVHGRPCGLLQVAPERFLLTDDKVGLVYEIDYAGAGNR